jgi:uncharacterized damage-inducible protein DinB
MTAERHAETAAREFRKLKALADRALARVPDDRYFTVPSEGANSLALLVKHMSGNMRSRWTEFLTSDGEKPWRDRDGEFEIGPDDTRAALSARWEEGWRLLFAALEGLGADDESRSVTIRGESLTVTQAIVRQLSHYAYHTGQIVYLAKQFAGRDWESLSVPRGGSKRFNEHPDPYL